MFTSHLPNLEEPTVIVMDMLLIAETSGIKLEERCDNCLDTREGNSLHRGIFQS
jgi:hypothetical protein